MTILELDSKGLLDTDIHCYQSILLLGGACLQSRANYLVFINTGIYMQIVSHPHAPMSPRLKSGVLFEMLENRPFCAIFVQQ